MDGASASSGLSPALADRSVPVRCCCCCCCCVEGEEVAVGAVLGGGGGAGCGVRGAVAVENVVGGVLHLLNGHVAGIGQLGFGHLDERWVLGKMTQTL